MTSECVSSLKNLVLNFKKNHQKNQKEKSKAKKPENPLKQNQTYHRKNKKNKNKTKSPTNVFKYFIHRELISFHLFVREDLTWKFGLNLKIIN